MRCFRLFLLSFLTFCELCLVGLAQVPTTIPVTGNLSQISGQGQAYSAVSVQLANCVTPVAITGYAVIVQTGYVLQANGSGVVNGSIWPNDKITCNATTGNSMYSVTYLVNGTPSGTPVCYQVASTQGSWNLNSPGLPVTCGTSPPNPTDGGYQNLNSTGFFQGNNGAMSGEFTVDGLLQALGGIQLASGQNCPGGQYMTGYSSLLLPACAVVAGSGVTSVYGRTGAVTAQTGDYSYTQISGTPTLYYSTVQVAGISQTQEPKLNFLVSSTITVTCADNPSNHSTDCTPATVGGTTNYQQWSLVGSGCTGPGTCTYSAVIPVAFGVGDTNYIPSATLAFPGGSPGCNWAITSALANTGWTMTLNCGSGTFNPTWYFSVRHN